MHLVVPFQEQEQLCLRKLTYFLVSAIERNII